METTATKTTTTCAHLTHGFICSLDYGECSLFYGPMCKYYVRHARENNPEVKK